jgi:hypothetical protein
MALIVDYMVVADYYPVNPSVNPEIDQGQLVQ